MDIGPATLQALVEVDGRAYRVTLDRQEDGRYRQVAIEQVFDVAGQEPLIKWHRGVSVPPEYYI
jgi:hypothetical protein